MLKAQSLLSAANGEVSVLNANFAWSQSLIHDGDGRENFKALFLPSLKDDGISAGPWIIGADTALESSGGLRPVQTSMIALQLGSIGVGGIILRGAGGSTGSKFYKSLRERGRSEICETIMKHAARFIL